MFVVSLMSPLWSQEPLPTLNEQSTLPDYLAYAALSNPGLEAAFLRWKAALERIPQAQSLPDPRFTYRYFIREIETRVGPQKQAFEIGQMFPWFGKLDLAGDVAAQTAKSQFQRYESAKRKLFLEVKIHLDSDIQKDHFFHIKSRESEGSVLPSCRTRTYSTTIP